LFKRDEILRRAKATDEKLDTAVCVLCGGNVDLVRLGKLVSKL